MRIAFLLITVISLGAAGAPLARAQGASANEAGAADPAYEGFITEALSAYDAGRWAEARTAFRRAHALAPTARTFRTIGMCSFNLGDYIDALQNLETALSDVRKPVTAEQRTQIAGLIERANAKLGRFRLKLVPEGAGVLVDGAAPALLGGHELLLEPGHHVIVASANGYRSLRRELAVEPGDRATLDLQLEPGADPLPVNAAASPAAAPTATAAPELADMTEPEEAPASRGGTQRVLGFVGIGLGGAGLVTFGVAGGLALGKKSTLDDACPDRQCGPAEHNDVDSYNRLRTISSVGLIAGGAFLTLGLVLLLTAPHAQSAEHATITPELGLGWAGVRGQL
jgi:hypothetical protein